MLLPSVKVTEKKTDSGSEDKKVWMEDVEAAAITNLNAKHFASDKKTEEAKYIRRDLNFVPWEVAPPRKTLGGISWK